MTTEELDYIVSQLAVIAEDYCFAAFYDLLWLILIAFLIRFVFNFLKDIAFKHGEQRGNDILAAVRFARELDKDE